MPGSSSTTRTRSGTSETFAVGARNGHRLHPQGQANHEQTTAPVAVGGPDLPAMLLHDALHDREAEAGAAPPPREERLEDLLEILRAADPNEFRDAVRTALVASEDARVAKLAGQSAALDQPAPFAAALGEDGAVSEARRKEILTDSLKQCSNWCKRRTPRGGLG